MDRLALRIGRLCGSEDSVDRKALWIGSMDWKALWIGRLCESEDSTDRKTLLIGRFPDRMLD